MRVMSPETRVILTEEFRRAIRRRSWQIFTLLVPALLLIALVAVPIVRDLVTGEEVPPSLSRVGYVDNADIVVNFNLPEGPHAFPDRVTGSQALLADEVDAIFILPEDYMETGEVQYFDIRNLP